MTARLKQAFNALPPHLVRKVKDLAARTGVSPILIIEESLSLYEKQMSTVPAVKDELQQKPELANLTSDPLTPGLINSVMSAFARLGNAQLSPEELSERGRAGAAARAKAVDAKKRSAIARKAALARWKDKGTGPELGSKS